MVHLHSPVTKPVNIRTSWLRLRLAHLMESKRSGKKGGGRKSGKTRGRRNKEQQGRSRSKEEQEKLEEDK